MILRSHVLRALYGLLTETDMAFFEENKIWPPWNLRVKIRTKNSISLFILFFKQLWDENFVENHLRRLRCVWYVLSAIYGYLKELDITFFEGNKIWPLWNLGVKIWTKNDNPEYISAIHATKYSFKIYFMRGILSYWLKIDCYSTSLLAGRSNPKTLSIRPTWYP